MNQKDKKNHRNKIEIEKRGIKIITLQCNHISESASIHLIRRKINEFSIN